MISSTYDSRYQLIRTFCMCDIEMDSGYMIINQSALQVLDVMLPLVLIMVTFFLE